MVPFVVKADGEREAFDRQKLLTSLKRAGADATGAEQITQDIEKELHDDISTSEIYRHAFARLREHRHSAAARYSLKRAVLDFGPSGFPFEVYLGEIFRFDGYEVKTDQIVQGGCIDHEVDVVLTRGNEITYIEAKFHNTPAFKTDLKTALYVKARLDDLAKRNDGKVMMRGLIVTNTKFTSKAVTYAECAGVDLLGWEYPVQDNLHDKIDAAKLYPITALTSLSRKEKDTLLNDKIVLCNDIGEQSEALHRAGIRGTRLEALFTEASGLCLPGKGI